RPRLSLRLFLLPLSLFLTLLLLECFFPLPSGQPDYPTSFLLCCCLWRRLWPTQPDPARLIRVALSSSGALRGALLAPAFNACSRSLLFRSLLSTCASQIAASASCASRAAILALPLSKYSSAS